MANEGEPVVGAWGDTPNHEKAPPELQWPEYLPESCPPSDAQPAAGAYYRIVDGDPPSPEDFLGDLRLQQLGLRRKRRWSDECKAFGVSILADLDEALRLRESVGPMRNKAIAYGDITGDGVVKHTPHQGYKSHHTWWIPAAAESHRYFRVVE